MNKPQNYNISLHSIYVGSIQFVKSSICLSLILRKHFLPQRAKVLNTEFSRNCGSPCGVFRVFNVSIYLLVTILVTLGYNYQCFKIHGFHHKLISVLTSNFPH